VEPGVTETTSDTLSYPNGTIASATSRQRPDHDPLRGHERSRLKLLSQELAQELSDSAARMARTHDEIARVHETIAQHGVRTSTRTTAAEHAEQARRFAKHERSELHHWTHEAEKHD